MEKIDPGGCASDARQKMEHKAQRLAQHTSREIHLTAAKFTPPDGAVGKHSPALDLQGRRREAAGRSTASWTA
jgi:hypothetical protein